MTAETSVPADDPEVFAWRYRDPEGVAWSITRRPAVASDMAARGYVVDALFAERRTVGGVSPNAAREAQRIIEKAAADVRRMLTEHAAKGGHVAELVGLIGRDSARRCEVENVLLEYAAGKRGPITPEEARALAMKLGVPENWDKKAPRP